MPTPTDTFAHHVQLLQKKLAADAPLSQAIGEHMPAIIAAGRHMRQLTKERNTFRDAAADALRRRAETAQQCNTIYVMQTQQIAMLQTQLAEALHAYRELKQNIDDFETTITTIEAETQTTTIAA